MGIRMDWSSGNPMWLDGKSQKLHLVLGLPIATFDFWVLFGSWIVCELGVTNHLISHGCFRFLESMLTKESGKTSHINAQSNGIHDVVTYFRTLQDVLRYDVQSCYCMRWSRLVRAMSARRNTAWAWSYICVLIPLWPAVTGGEKKPWMEILPANDGHAEEKQDRSTCT